MKRNLFSTVPNLLAIGFIPLVVVFHFFVNFITKSGYPYSSLERIIVAICFFVLAAILVALFKTKKKVVCQ